jgi:hypothetical protein
MSTAAQIAANQANSQLSTGPRTEEGKAASARNNFRHGLCGAFLIQSWENAADYDSLLDGLRDEHQPVTPTEALLVERMAQHWWLGQRALRLQEFCFKSDVPMLEQDGEKELALYLRYQTTHERAFQKCLSDLLKMRAQNARELREADARRRHKADEARKQEMHQARLEAVQVKTELQKTKLAAKTNTQPNALAPAPNSDLSERVREAFAIAAAQQAELDAYLRTA